MPTDSNEDRRSTSSTGSNLPGWVEQDPQGVTLVVRASGWTEPPARGLRAFAREVTSPLGDSFIRWDRWDIPELRLSQQASLLMLQGMSPQKIFENCYIHVEGGWDYVGLFLYLKGQYDASDPIPRLKNVVVGRPKDYQANLSEERLAMALVEEVLKH